MDWVQRSRQQLRVPDCRRVFMDGPGLLLDIASFSPPSDFDEVSLNSLAY